MWLAPGRIDVGNPPERAVGKRPPRMDAAAQPELIVDLDRWDLLAGFDLVPRDGTTVFRVGTELLRDGGRAVEAAVEAGFPDGTELEYLDGSWVVVLPYDRGDSLDAPARPVDLEPPPGYEWAEHDGRPVLRLRERSDEVERPAFHPPGGRAGWRWRPAGDLGWVLVPPPGLTRRPAAAPPAAPPRPRPRPADASMPAPAPAPASPAPTRPAETPDRAARRSRVLDLLGVVLIALGLGVAAVLLLPGGDDEGVPADAAELAGLLGVAPADLLAAVTAHQPAELTTSVAPPTDPVAQVVATALVLIDVDEADAARLAESVAGSPAPGQQLVVLLVLGGDEPALDASYRYALFDAARPVIRAPEGDDADGTARLDLRRAYFYDPAAGELVAVAQPGGEEVATAAFAARSGRYVIIGAPLEELTGGTVFGHALVRPSGTGPIAYTLSPPYQVR